MTYHPSSAVSVATVMVAITIASVVTTAIAYRTGRAHAAWRDVRTARLDVPRKRRIAWSHTRGLALTTVILVGTLAAVAWNAGAH
jgi:hypothetical protein